VTETTPFQGQTVCHLYAGTCYDQPSHQIWSLYVGRRKM